MALNYIGKIGGISPSISLGAGAAPTLTSQQSGTIFNITAVVGIITLPAAQAGLNYKFVRTAAIGSAAITAPGTLIHGFVSVNGAIVANAAAVNGATSINFVAQAGLGDWIQLFCDGTNWAAIGYGFTAGVITFSA